MTPPYALPRNDRPVFLRILPLRGHKETLPKRGNVIQLRNLCHSEVAQQPWESVSKRYYGLPRRFAPRNDNLNLMILG